LDSTRSLVKASAASDTVFLIQPVYDEAELETRIKAFVIILQIQPSDDRIEDQIP